MVTINKNLNLDKLVLKLSSEVNQKLSLLSRVTKLVSFNKRKIPFKTFVEPQFKYCTIIWMFYSRRTNNKIDKLHERP